jgi:hypothetical protein
MVFDSFDEDGEFADFLRQLVDLKHLEDKAKEMARKVISDGIESLSKRQRSVFDQEVFNEFVTKTCQKCSHPIPWNEMFDAYNNGGFCNYCASKIAESGS